MRHDERLTSMPHLCSCSAHAGNIRKMAILQIFPAYVRALQAL